MTPDIRAIESARMTWWDMGQVWDRQGNGYRILVGKKTKGKRPLGRPRCRWR